MALTSVHAERLQQPAPSDDTLGFNIALGALGGHVITATDSGDPERGPDALIDGFPVIRGFGSMKTSLGWRSADRDFPQSIVLGFRENREATITAVVLDTASADNLAGSGAVPTTVEVQVSTTGPDAGFTRVGSVTCAEVAREEVVRFAPVKARFVKLVIGGTHGGDEPQIGEVQVYEPAAAVSVVADLPKNLLAPALGGSFVSFSSQDRDGAAVNLIDGRVGNDAGWASGPSDLGAASHLPQSFVFAFRDHRAAAIDRVVIDPTSLLPFYLGPQPYTKTWAKTVEVATSDDPWDRFQALPLVTIPEAPKPVTIPIGRTARYLRVRVIDNYGAESTTLGEISAFERQDVGAASIVRGRAKPVESDPNGAAAGPDIASRREQEPNDSTETANPIGGPGPIGGRITPDTDRDVFRVPGNGTTAAGSKQVVTVDLEGRPEIRTRVGVLDASGSTVFDWDPAKVNGTTAKFSVAVDAGDVFLRLTQPPAAQVVIWDTSGSMVGRTADLEAALKSYLARLRPIDRVNLIRFDDTVEVLMKDFSVDQKALTNALADKVYADGGTAIYDAVLEGLSRLSPVGGNRAIVLLTDGEDTSSTAEPSTYWQRLRAGHTRVFAIGLGNGLRGFVGRAGATGARVLANTARATQGVYLHADSSAQLPAFYERISTELRAPATYAVAATTTSAAGTIAVTSTGDRLTAISTPRIELVLDASGSMQRQIDGKTMMATAKEVLNDAIRRLPDNADVALRVYGQHVAEGKPGACEDSELAVPFAPLDRNKLIARVNAVNALGVTPIAHSITAAGADLAGHTGPSMIIIVTDGEESCGGDPVAAALALRAKGMPVTVNLVGFGLSTTAERVAMTKMAAAGGGQYFEASGQAALRTALDRAMAASFDVLDAAGRSVAHGAIGGPPVAVPAGTYSVRFGAEGDVPLAEHVTVSPNQTTSIVLKKEGQEVSVRVSVPPARGGGTP